MIATAMAVAEATKKALYSDDVRELAFILIESKDDVSKENYSKMLFMLMSLLSAKVGDLTTKVFLTEKQFSEMMKEINDLENISEKIENEK